MAAHSAMASPRLRITALLVGAVLGGCGAPEGPEGFAPPAVGSPAPEYGARTLGGDDLALSDLRGKVVLLNVWATWCGPCVREMPKLQELHAIYEADGLSILGASIDRGAAESEVRSFVEANGIAFEILLDPDASVETRFRTLGVPESFLIDRQGILRARWIGEFDPMAESVRSEIEALLSEATS